MPTSSKRKELSTSPILTSYQQFILLTQSSFRIVFYQFALIDGSDSQLPLHCSDEGGSLEEGPCQCFYCLHRKIDN